MRRLFRKPLSSTNCFTVSTILFLLLSHLLFGIERSWPGQKSLVESVSEIITNTGKPIYRHQPPELMRVRPAFSGKPQREKVF